MCVGAFILFIRMRARVCMIIIVQVKEVNLIVQEEWKGQ